MKLSIVMVLDKTENHLCHTIHSILEQTYKDIELILIDISGLEENTNLLKPIINIDCRVKFYQNTNRLDGIAECFNWGFSETAGSYFMKMSSGIILMPDTIERIMHILQRRKNIDFIYTDAFFQDQRGCIHEEMQYLNNEIEELYLYHPARGCFIYKRKVHEVLEGYRKNCIYDINNDFWIRANDAGFSMYHVKGKCYSCILSQRVLSVNNRNKLMDLRIGMCQKATQLRDISIKKKVLTSIIEQCRQYKRYREGFSFMLYLAVVKSLFFMNITWKNNKIIEDSKTSFDIMADNYERAWGLRTVRECYGPVLNIVKEYASDNVKLLDVGCGTGVMLKRISDEFPNAAAIQGIDLSPMMVEKANEKLRGENAYVVEGTLETVDLPKDFYNIVLCMHSFHHYPEPLKNLRQMYKILQRKGMLVIADNYFQGWKRIKRNIDLYKKNYPAGDMWMYSFCELFVLTRLAGFKQQGYQEIGGSFIFTCKKI